MNRERTQTILKIIGVAACLYLFLVGIGGLGYSFKLFGKEFSQKILEATSSPMLGLFIGVLATTIVQSSSTTTSIVARVIVENHPTPNTVVSGFSVASINLISHTDDCHCGNCDHRHYTWIRLHFIHGLNP